MPAKTPNKTNAPITAMVKNLVAWREEATPDEYAIGRRWYGDASDFIDTLAAQFGKTREVCAAVVAVLSPSVSWPSNKKAAYAVLAAHREGSEDRPSGVVGYGRNYVKAFTILRENEVRFCSGMCLSSKGTGRIVKCRGDHCGRRPLHGRKVVEFYHTMLGEVDGRVMDVWATRAADVHPNECRTLPPNDPRREGLPAGRWDALQEAYAIAAEQCDETPADMQAIVWVVIRNCWIKSDGNRYSIDRGDA